MTDFFQKHKKPCVISGAVVLIIIFAIYLYLFFFPGFWYRDVFLRKEKSPFEGMEVYSGHDAVNSADYELTMAKEGKTAYLAFTVNETERLYEITSDNSESYYPSVTITENGEQVFSGTYSFYLEDENGEPFEPLISIGYGPYTPTEEELFPSYNWLYNVSQSARTEIRGEPVWLIFIVIIAVVTVLDMIYPDLFWEIRHWLDVNGGEPSDFYRFVQKIGWVAAPILIFVFMIISLMPKNMLL